jgi:protein-L-isoaspartate(D-aspartate) O-methyltransferase
MNDFAAARTKMVDSQLRTESVTDYGILSVMGAVPRELFVPPAQRALAYLDRDVPLDADGGSPRYLMEAAPFARLLQLANLGPSDRVLDIGCGSGYSVAVMAQLAGTVVGLESDAGLAKRATATLADLGVTNASVVIGPLEMGHASSGPFDAIIIEGAVEVVPPALFAQLTENGRLVAVVGTGRSAVATIFAHSEGQVGRRAAFDIGVRELPGFRKPPAFVF